MATRKKITKKRVTVTNLLLLCAICLFVYDGIRQKSTIGAETLAVGAELWEHAI